MDTSWTREEAEKHFFIYHQRIGSADLLHPLGTTLTSDSDLQQIAVTLHTNLQATAMAASFPDHVALVGTFNGRFFAIEQLMKNALEGGGMASLRSAASILDDSGGPIRQSFYALRMVHQNPKAMEAVHALLRQATAMTWGAFETFTLDLFELLVTRDLKFLQEIVAGRPRNEMPKQLLNHVEKELERDPSLGLEAMLESFKGSMMMNIGSIRDFFGILFQSEANVASSLNAPRLRVLSARRHLLMHRAGVVDQRYVTDSGETLPLGSSLVVTPEAVHQGFEAVVSAASTLIRAADARL